MGIPAFFLTITENITSNLQSWKWAISSIKWILICGAFIFSLSAYFKTESKNERSQNVLKDIASNKKNNECALWDYGKTGYGAISLADTWQQEIKGLLVTTNRPDLDYHNFGEEFCFFDLSTGKSIEIPTGNRARSEKVGDSIRVGMVLRLMPKAL